MDSRIILKALFLGGLVYFISGCSSTPTTTTTSDNDAYPSAPIDVSQVPDAVPKAEPKSRYGNPPSYKQFGNQYYVLDSSHGYREQGIASWYGTKFHGRRTSSGDPYDMYTMTAAHKTLPLPSYARVTNIENGKSVIVRINDRGPFHDNRVIDLSYAAAHRIGVLQNGTGKVIVEAIDPLNPNAVLANSAAQGLNNNTVIASAAADNNPLFVELAPSNVPLATTPSTPENAPPTPAQSGGPVYLQAGAFSLQQRADGLAAQIRQVSNNPVSVRPITHNNQTIYRVQVGPFPDTATANLASSQISTISQQIPLLVKEENVL